MESIPEDHAHPEQDPPSDGSERSYFSLESTSKDGQPQFRAFADLTLDYLKRIGLPEVDRLHTAPAGLLSAHEAEDRPNPHDPGLCKATLDNGQDVYLLFDTDRCQVRGHRQMAALSRKGAEKWLVGSAAEKAAIAATTVLYLNEAIDIRRLRRALALIEEPLTKSAEEHRKDTVNKMVKAADEKYNYGIDDEEKWSEEIELSLQFTSDLQPQSLEYVLALLRYRRPNFNDYPCRAQVELILTTCEHINELLKAARKLAAFLEYGMPSGLPNKTVDNVNRDVRAAVLRDVVGLSYREIGEDLGVNLPPRANEKGSHDTVRHMVGRGRGYLERALGKDGWRSKAEAMRTDMERYNALSEDEQTLERLAEHWGVSEEEVLTYPLPRRDAIFTPS